MSSMAVTVASFMIVTGVTFLAGLLLLRWWPAVQRERLTTTPVEGGAESILRWDERASARWQRTVERIGRAVGGSPDTAPSKYRRRLIWGGYHDPRAVLVFMGAKVALAVLGGCGYFLYGLIIQRVLPNLISTSLILGAAAFFLPDFWLHNRIRARQREIVNALPDVLDLLMVCVEAGMGFDAAVARIAEQPEVRKSPLHQELLRMHLEVRAGRPRQEALRGLGERCGVQEVKSLVGAFIQTERLGTPLGKTLRVHADSARVQRRHRAEARAHLAPLKMIFPTVFFLFPAFFLVTLAPSLLSLLTLFRALRSGLR